MFKDLVLLNTDGNGDVFYRGEDALNQRRYRNENNVEDFEYNCCGYAFETYNWITVYPTYDLMLFLEDTYFEEQEEEDIAVRTFKTDDEFTEVSTNINRIINSSLSIFKDKKFASLVRERIYDVPNFLFPYVIKIIIDNLMATFKDVRRIKDFSELQEDEYGIAMATSSFDYHFAKYEDGIISHKMGGRAIEVVESLDDAFEKYPSKRFFFAKKKAV